MASPDASSPAASPAPAAPAVPRGTSRRRYACGLLSCVAVALVALGGIKVRLIRNVMLSSELPAMPPAFPPCDMEEFARDVTVIVGMKDTCHQSLKQLEHLKSLIPANTPLLYAMQDMVGCRQVQQRVARKLKEDFTAGRLMATATLSPFGAWRESFAEVRTNYSLLMHNDVYAIDKYALCEMYQSMKVAPPEVAVVAPQLYERGLERQYVTHAAHANLHLEARKDDPVPWLVADLQVSKVLERKAEDFVPHFQDDFLEDHAFVARSEVLNRLIDSDSAYTQEYLDMILNLREEKERVWYEPSSRVEFSVDPRNLRWGDIPFFTYRRSEEMTNLALDHISKKWGVRLQNTGFPNYIKMTYLTNVEMNSPALGGPGWDTQDSENPVAPAPMLPASNADQRILAAAWFQYSGFNRFGDELDIYPAFTSKVEAGRANPDKVPMGRVFTMQEPLQAPTERTAVTAGILPQDDQPRRMAAEIAFRYFPFTMARVSAESLEALQKHRAFEHCGLVVSHEDSSADCWILVAPFKYNKRSYLTRLLESLCYALKLPHRVLVYLAMKTSIKEVGELPSKHPFAELLACRSSSMADPSDAAAKCRLDFRFGSGSTLHRWRGTFVTQDVFDELVSEA